jgi:hypothetical protein
MEANIYTKVNAIKQLFLGVQTDARNDFSKYEYLTLNSINKILIPAEIDARLYHRITFTAETATLEIINLDNTNETIVVEKRLGTAALTACHDAQNAGAAETYARRYLLMAAFDIAADDVLDSGVHGEPGRGRPPERRPNPQQQNHPQPQGRTPPPQGQPRNQAAPRGQPGGPPRNQPPPRGPAPAAPAGRQGNGGGDPLAELKNAVWREIRALPEDEQDDWINAATGADEGELRELLTQLGNNAKARAARAGTQHMLDGNWGPYPAHNPER